jgi:hypothetical protein
MEREDAQNKIKDFLILNGLDHLFGIALREYDEQRDAWKMRLWRKSTKLTIGMIWVDSKTGDIIHISDEFVGYVARNFKKDNLVLNA